MYRDVEREPLPFFLREVNQKKLSGHLYVSAKDFHISLNFLDGRLANGMSTRFDEKLSVILHLMGNINEEQYNFLSGLHQFSDDQVAGILIDQNFAKKKDIYYARIFQLRRIAISTFALNRGHWIFTAGEPDPPLREIFEIPLAGILVEGARSIDHISSYAGRWQRQIPVLFPEIPQDIEIYFTDAERAFYAALQRQGPVSCQELLARLNMLPNDFWRGLLAFHLMGVAEFEKDERHADVSSEIAAMLELQQALQAGDGDVRRLLGLPAAAGAAAVEEARAGLLARFAPERFGSAAAPEIKNIARDVCRRLRELGAGPRRHEEIVVELEEPTAPGLRREEEMVIELGEPLAPGLRREEEPVSDLEKTPVPGLRRDEELVIELEEPAAPGRQRGEEIVGDLGKTPVPGLRHDEELVIELEKPLEPGRWREQDIVVAAEEPAMPPFAGADEIVEALEPELLTEADLVADGDQAEPELLSEADRVADEEAAGPEFPRSAGLPAGPFAPPRIEFEPELEVHVEIESDEPAPPAAAPSPVAAEVKAPAAAKAPPPPAETPPRPFAPISAPPSLRMVNEDHEKAWELLLQSKELYERREFAKAVPLLKKAIRLESGQGDFYHLLGLCQSESELTRNEAEINLKKAIELKSWSADPVYALGVLYRSQGKMKLAERCFQRVKEISYEHTGASRALVDLRRRKAGERGAPPAPKKKKL